MESLLQKLEAHNPSKISLKDSCKQNNIKISYLNHFSIRKARKIFKKLQIMYEHDLKPIRCNWFENQLKVFQFTLLFLSNINGKKILQFGEPEWNQLSLIFRTKELAQLQYEAMNFVANRNILKKKWDELEDSMLINYLKQQQDNTNWNKIAITLFFASNKLYFRTGKQCKERWLNHLDPQIKHGNWHFEEDKILIESVRKNGKKWALITKQFHQQRTQHMVKNRYISLILKNRKKYPDIVEEQQILEQISRDMLLNIQNDEDDLIKQREKLRSNKKDKLVIKEEEHSISQSLRENHDEKKIQIDGPEKISQIDNPQHYSPPTIYPYFPYPPTFTQGFSYFPALIPSMMPNGIYFT